LDLLLGVETRRGVGRAVAFAAAAADGGELGILPDLDPPAGGVGEVPVQAVQLVTGHAVEQALDAGLAGEVPAFVEHEAAPAEARGVGDDRSGELQSAGGIASGALDELGEGLQTVEMPGGRCGVDVGASRGDTEMVAFALRSRGAGGKAGGGDEPDGRAGASGGGFHSEAGGLGERVEIEPDGGMGG